uniref:Vacuolar protein sorting-associated protein 35 n=1 Tax=Neobodo designis TaxID=312471 RepID=A0A7S1LP92_NEODS
MLAELRTSMLTPQYYYELYMRVFNEMQPLEAFFYEEVRSGRQQVENLYATVQHAGNIVPRLMLLITIGSVYIKSQAAPAKDILQDLIEMVKGVQHPTRGLFVRHYLSTLLKNKLPDVDNEYEGTGGTVIDSATFVLRNFREMAWLWYRMETKSNVRDKRQRDRERSDLRLLIGFNLVRLSQLDGIDKAMYQDRILPVVLQIILDFKEPIQQQYLLEVVVQVFPDEFHLATLKSLLEAVTGVVSGVNVQSVLGPLMERLGNYVVSVREGTTEATLTKKEEKMITKMFALFQEKISELVNQHSQQSFPPVAFMETAFALMKLTLRAYPDAHDRVDGVLGLVHQYFSQTGSVDDASAKVLRKALDFAIAEIGDINTVLDFENYVSVIGLLSFARRREVGKGLVEKAATLGVKIDTAERVGKLFEIISPMVKDVDDTPANKEDIYTIDVEEEFIEEQHVVCKALHLVDSPDLKELNRLYSAMRRELGKGGPERMRYTLKAMSSLYIRLALRVKKAEVNGETPGVSVAKLFNYLYTGDGGGILEHLASQVPVEAFHMFLTAANAADTCDQHELETCYNLYASAFQLYEENGGSTKLQLQMLNAMISSLSALRTMPEDRYDTLASKLCQYSSKLVHKPDQSRMVMLCSHMFWKKALSEDLHKKASECLSRALKLADNVPAGLQFGLFAEILNHYAYYYNAQMPQATPKTVNAVVAMNRDAIESTEDKTSETFKTAKRFYSNTRAAISQRAAAGDERWGLIEV